MGLLEDRIGILDTITSVLEDRTCVSDNGTGASYNRTGLLEDRIGILDTRTCVSDDRTCVSDNGTCASDDRTGLLDDRIGILDTRTCVLEDRTGVSDNGTRASDDRTGVLAADGSDICFNFWNMASNLRRPACRAVSSSSPIRIRWSGLKIIWICAAARSIKRKRSKKKRWRSNRFGSEIDGDGRLSNCRANS